MSRNWRDGNSGFFLLLLSVKFSFLAEIDYARNLTERYSAQIQQSWNPNFLSIASGYNWIKARNSAF
jgi:hypothetical protein